MAPGYPTGRANRRLHALSVSFLAKALPRSRAAGYADAVRPRLISNW
jgi:hypothetical protein